MADYIRLANERFAQAQRDEEQRAKALWTPEGDRPLPGTVGHRGRNVQVVSPREMKTFEDLHALAHKLKIEIRCPACDYSFQGFNNAGVNQSRLTSIFCNCREIRAENLIVRAS